MTEVFVEQTLASPGSAKIIINLEWQFWSKSHVSRSSNVNKQCSIASKTEATWPFLMLHNAYGSFIDDSSCFLTFPDSSWDFLRLSGNSWVFVLSECFTTLLDMDCFIYIAALFLASNCHSKVILFKLILVTSPGTSLLSLYNNNTDWTKD